MVLYDAYNRPVTNLRISLTSSCNLSCIYCHAEGECSPGKEMGVGQIAGIMQVAAKFGVKSVKFTGGEPLIRKDIAEIVRAVPEGMESSMTTNGTLLADSAADLAEAGLSRVNVSLDSLDRTTYKRITGSDLLDSVLAGIDAALDADLAPVKLNMVVLEGINDKEIEDFIAFVRGNRRLVLQLIELMKIRDCSFHSDLNGLEAGLATRSREVLTRRMHHRRKYCLDGAEVEVVRPLHNTEFCAFCNRLRVTSDGKFKPCLLRKDNHLDACGKQGEELESVFREAVSRREPFFK